MTTLYLVAIRRFGENGKECSQTNEARFTYLKSMIRILTTWFILCTWLSPVTEHAAAQDKFLYSSSIVLTLAHGGMVDALVWEPNKQRLPGFVTNDFTYIGGSGIVLSLNLISARNWKPKNKREFWFTTVGSIFVGSVLWDWTFSELRYGDPLYPLPNWYGGFGFKRKQDRVAFDVGRLLIGGMLIFLSDK